MRILVVVVLLECFQRLPCTPLTRSIVQCSLFIRLPNASRFTARHILSLGCSTVCFLPNNDRLCEGCYRISGAPFKPPSRGAGN
uniref:Putative secreted peptide n=1 Tax=Anopheles braziliensis TaxID=58242 RepID=A0A2M3ZUU7_9DIPT